MDTILGVRVSHDKDYCVFGSTLGSPSFGKVHAEVREVAGRVGGGVVVGVGGGVGVGVGLGGEGEGEQE